MMERKKDKYLAPEVELIVLRRPLSLLATLSLDGEVEDWEDLGDI